MIDPKKHASLFTGIGGFDLAAECMGWENVFQCEIDPYCNKLLKQNFPNTTKHGNIKETDFTIYRRLIDVLSGGFPCQPYSTAGKRLGKEDERHLWPENYRAILEIQPPWVVGENVRGLTNWNRGLVFDEVQADLEAAGYEVTPFLLPAAGINAPHKRDRIFFLAYSASFRRGRDFHEGQAVQRRKQAFGEIRTSDNATVTNTKSNRDCGGLSEVERKNGSERESEKYGENNSEFINISCQSDATNTNAKGLEKQQCVTGNNEPEQQTAKRNLDRWQNWPAQPGLCGGDDGVSHRVDRIKGLGNAVVPQLVLQIFKAIEAYEKLYNERLHDIPACLEKRDEACREKETWEDPAVQQETPTS